MRKLPGVFLEPHDVPEVSLSKLVASLEGYAFDITGLYGLASSGVNRVIVDTLTEVFGFGNPRVRTVKTKEFIALHEIFHGTKGDNVFYLLLDLLHIPSSSNTNITITIWSSDEVSARNMAEELENRFTSLLVFNTKNTDAMEETDDSLPDKGQMATDDASRKSDNDMSNLNHTHIPVEDEELKELLGPVKETEDATTAKLKELQNRWIKDIKNSEENQSNISVPTKKGKKKIRKKRRT